MQRICSYLLGTKDKGIMSKPYVSCGLACHIDADFAGGRVDGDQNNPESVLSQAGYFVSFAGYHIHWWRKIETEIALSTIEDGYIALLIAMRYILPFLNLMTEIKAFLPISICNPKLFYTIF